jgi:hypothetical protein
MFIRSSSGTLKLPNLSFLDPDRMDNLWKAHSRAELAGALQAKEQISLELNARARKASDLAQALAEQGCKCEQAELALAREKSLNVQLANDLEGRTDDASRLLLHHQLRFGRS